MPRTSTTPPSKADEAWKSVLDVYFPAFMQFFFPQIDNDIDWSQGHTMLDKELSALTTEAMIGKRLVDKLVQLTTKTGHTPCLHVEIQGGYESTFAQRVFSYHGKLYERYGQSILSLVVFTDDRPRWRPQHYQTQAWGQPVIHFRFLTHKLLDHQGREAELLAQANPFGLIVAAQLAAIHTRGDAPARYERKLALTCHLYEKKLGRDDFHHLHYFIEGVLTLPKSFKLRYHDQMKQFEQENDMPYMTTAEEIGWERGRQEGRQEGQQEGRQEGRQEGELAVLWRLLKRRFRSLSKAEEAALEKKLAHADAETLLEWSENLLDAETLDQVFKSH